MNLPQRPRDTEKINQITGKIVHCALEVHRLLGPGLGEDSYETALCIEFDDGGVRYERQKRVVAYYKGQRVGEYRVDLLVEDLVIVEIKSVERPLPLFEAQLLNYLRQTQKPVGLLINFNSRLLKDGITRRAI